MESFGDQITLWPVRETGRIAVEHGVWVFRTGAPLSASSTSAKLLEMREERDLVSLAPDD